MLAALHSSGQLSPTTRPTHACTSEAVSPHVRLATWQLRHQGYAKNAIDTMGNCSISCHTHFHIRFPSGTHPCVRLHEATAHLNFNEDLKTVNPRSNAFASVAATNGSVIVHRTRTTIHAPIATSNLCCIRRTAHTHKQSQLQQCDVA